MIIGTYAWIRGSFTSILVVYIVAIYYSFKKRLNYTLFCLTY